MRARWWSPQVGAFLSIDELAYQDVRSTLWGWPRQNALKWSDPSGHYAGSLLPVAPSPVAAPVASGMGWLGRVGIGLVTGAAVLHTAWEIYKATDAVRTYNAADCPASGSGSASSAASNAGDSSQGGGLPPAGPPLPPTMDGDGSDGGSSATGRDSQGGIDTSGRGLQHAEDRHTVGGAQNANASTFSQGENLEGLVQAAEGQVATLQRGGNFQTIVNTGRTIGVDRVTGLTTQTYTVITTPGGRLITLFPGVP